MHTAGELTFYEQVGEKGRNFSVHKPFSEVLDGGLTFMRVGALLTLLPKPPARILECGCGAGWLSCFLQRRGHEVIGADVVPDVIRLARDHAERLCVGKKPPSFIVADSENLPFEKEFDAVVFFDSLHHVLDERQALAGAWRALKDGGICIALEPGHGHQRRSREVIERFGVTEKDMPPIHVGRLGRAVGFRRWDYYPAIDKMGKALYAPDRFGGRWLQRLLRWRWLRYGVAFAAMILSKRHTGITVLTK